ncbi:MAG: hypothetical protein CTY39_02650 [Hyphomicrobium sp.]|nr:MAG: hypothetical protein CTY39_02650 [Hyphomicrobium sp.]
MNTIARHDVSLPSSYQQAKKALGECVRLDECKTWLDKAAAIKAYARMANDADLEKEATRVRAWAKRRMGQIIEAVEPLHTGRPSTKNRACARPNSRTRKSVIEAAGIGETSAKEAVRIASIPQAEFDAKVESDNPPSIVDLVQMAEPPPKHNAEHFLKGRTKAQFNNAIRFAGAFKTHADSLADVPFGDVLPHLQELEREKIREALKTIEPIYQAVKQELLRHG